MYANAILFLTDSQDIAITTKESSECLEYRVMSVDFSEREVKRIISVFHGLRYCRFLIIPIYCIFTLPAFKSKYTTGKSSNRSAAVAMVDRSGFKLAAIVTLGVVLVV